jgi:hypothetical protein
MWESKSIKLYDGKIESQYEWKKIRDYNVISHDDMTKIHPLLNFIWFLVLQTQDPTKYNTRPHNKHHLLLYFPMYDYDLYASRFHFTCFWCLIVPLHYSFSTLFAHNFHNQFPPNLTHIIHHISWSRPFHLHSNDSSYIIFLLSIPSHTIILI